MKTNDNMLKIAVVGAGASGLAAAIFAKREALRVHRKTEICLYDGNARVGKKILVTGNGRCNFSNEDVRKEHFRGESDLAYKICSEFDTVKTVEFFRSLGLMSKADQAGRIYPMSLQATAVLDVLRAECAKLGIREITETKITLLKKSGKGYLLNDSIYADKVIIATGGKAAPVQGSDGSGFRLLEPFNIAFAPLMPALTPIVCDKFTKALKGIRANGKISIKCNGRIYAEDTGEIQYTDYGLSGIPSMQVSRFAAELLADKNNTVQAIVDSAPSFTSVQLKEILSELVIHHPDFTGEMLLSSIMPKKLGSYLLTECSLNPSRPVGGMHQSVIEKIVNAIKNKKYTVSSVKGFSDAQVTAGGILAKEIDSDTMELKKVKGIYVCGEIVNVDGACGGYNLQWAWSSAYKAGTNIVREN